VIACCERSCGGIERRHIEGCRCRCGRVPRPDPTYGLEAGADERSFQAVRGGLNPGDAQLSLASHPAPRCRDRGLFTDGIDVSRRVVDLQLIVGLPRRVPPRRTRHSKPCRAVGGRSCSTTDPTVGLEVPVPMTRRSVGARRTNQTG